MKKILFLTVFLSLAVSSFAEETIPNRYIFIEGTANRADHLEFFMTNFKAEAFGAGYTVTGTKNESAYTVSFKVSPNMVTDPDGTRRQPSPEENQYVIKISLIRNSDEFEVLVFDFFFSSLDEMYEYNRSLFLRAVSTIPPLTEDDLIVVQINDTWRNKWLYFRLSFDYPITFYVLQGKGLFKDVGLFYDDGDPDHFRTAPLDHKIIAMPGVSAGVEGQFLDFMSVELNFQGSFGDTRSNTFFNMALGAEVKFPLKFFSNLVLAPYGTFVYHLNVSDIFKDFPPFAVGGGIQVSTRGGMDAGAFFLDVKYLFSFSDAVMKNPYLDFPEGKQLYPSPTVIHYQRSVIGIGVGYKYGLFDRKKKESKTDPAADADNSKNKPAQNQ